MQQRANRLVINKRITDYSINKLLINDELYIK
jgi:hypothetical protein